MASTNGSTAISQANGTAPDDLTTPTTPTPWEEEDYLSALAHITHLQSQLDSLRDTIPSLTRPIVSLQPSHQPAYLRSFPSNSPERRRHPQVALGAIKEAGIRGAKGVADVRREWEGERTKDILKTVEESRAKDGDVGSVARVEGESDSRGW